jgi:prefoldin subunit 5
VVRNREQLNQKIAAIDQEQQRIRQNMGQLDRNSELYRRYVQKFGEQESSIEKMRGEIEKLTAEENKLRDELGQYLSNLTL